MMDVKDWWDKYLPNPPKIPESKTGKEVKGAEGLDPKHYGVK